MRIGIEAQRLFRKKKHGMDMVVLELIRNLQEIDKVNEYFIFVKPDVDNQLIRETPNFHIIELGGGPYPIWEQIALPKAAKKYQCDLLHCTSNTGPVNTSIPLMITLHDIIYMESLSLLKKDGTWYQKLGNVYRRWNVPVVVRKSKTVITVSDFERERISRFFGLNSSKLHTVYNGVGRHFRPISDKTELERIAAKYRLPEKFMFFLGNTDPKKNTRGVLKAYAEFRKTSATDYKLVMPDYEETALAALLKELDCPEIREHIHLTGYIINTDLPGIINLSTLFLYPSLRESFGIPILEGMACGIPVITSNTSSMPEIAGDSAFIIDPFKPEEITAAMNKILDNSDLYKQLSEKGIQRAALFSWENMAKSVLQLYNEFSAK
ncbi:MAG: glycosyltransferase family 4 protein [Prolixibacteraceae bacterium]|nr:glycosyltransferase family 4 protein [Prolixibacteraceae bacterium]